jgi:hypothetical protein
MLRLSAAAYLLFSQHQLKSLTLYDDTQGTLADVSASEGSTQTLA